MAKMVETKPTFVVVHPLDDAPETKRSADGLGRMPLRLSVKLSLFVLRSYLATMGLLVAYRVLHEVIH